MHQTVGPAFRRRPGRHSERVHELMTVAVLRAGLRVVLAALDAARRVQLRVGGRRYGFGLLSLLSEIRRAVGRQDHQIVADARVIDHGRRGGPWLGGHGAGREGGHPEADGPHMLTNVSGALTVLAGAIAL